MAGSQGMSPSLPLHNTGLVRAQRLLQPRQVAGFSPPKERGSTPSLVVPPALRGAVLWAERIHHALRLSGRKSFGGLPIP